MRTSGFFTVHRVLTYFILGMLVVALIGFFFVVDHGDGVVTRKWFISDTDCDEDSNGRTHCNTTLTYYVEMRDGRVFTVYWGHRDWGNLYEGQHISYTARGFRIDFLRWYPTIMSYKILEDTRR